MLERLKKFLGWNIPEKRVFIRIKSHHLVKYKIIDDSQKVLSFARNISAGGILFYSEKKLPLNSTIEIKINIPPKPTPLNVVGKIVRVHPLKKIGGYEIGLEFVHIDEEDRNLIEKLVLSSTLNL
ncbi:MAG: PilZ domain-containing protein [Candidatus Omnitrophica bacterium]|jgi:c-di-GMP-binding flagellar brake protein YcgR|nr:PilZ domain-containing protein [Candidatus Omnitrophota bacterium]